MQQHHRHSQQGLALGLVFLILVVVTALVVFFVNSMSSAPNSTTTTNKTYAITVIDQGNNYSAAFTNLLNNQSVPASSITFDNGTYGLLNPSNGGTLQTPPAAALASATAPNGFWIYKQNNVTVNNVGTSAAEYAVVLGGLSNGICGQVNQQLHNSTAIPASGIAAATWTGSTTAATSPTNTTAVDMSGVAAVNGWLAGCVATSDAPAQYVYYVVVNPV